MSNYLSVNLSELAESFKALSNPNRLQIYMRLLSCCAPGTACSTQTINSFCVGELGEDLAVAPSTLSHHIKELQHAGLIKTRRRGQNVECYVDMEKITILKEFFASPLSGAEQELKS